MRNITGLFCLGIFLLLTSCSEDDLCQKTVTYRKAIAEYGNLEDFRSSQINSPPRSLTTPTKIFVSEELLIIGEKDQGIHIIDNSNPSVPVYVNFLEIPGNREMAVEDGILYVDSYYDMLAIDISNPEDVVIKTRIEEAFRTKLFDQNNDVLLDFEIREVTEELSCDDGIYENTLVWMDYNGSRIPESALPTSFVSNGAKNFGTVNRMAINDNYLYVIGAQDMTIFNLENKSLSANHHIEHFDNRMETIYPSQDHLFVGTMNGMNIYNLSNPSEPALSGSFWHATACDPVLPTDSGLAYVTLRSTDECPGNENSLNVLDIKNLTRPNLLHSLDLKSPYAMSIANDVLYVGEGNNGFRVYSINGAQLTEILHNRDITAYDIIPHPTNKDVMLFAGPEGIFQYVLQEEKYQLLSQL